MSNTLEDLKPSKNKLYTKHKHPNKDIEELEKLREDYLAKKIAYLAKRVSTPPGSEESH